VLRACTRHAPCGITPSPADNPLIDMRESREPVAESPAHGKSGRAGREPFLHTSELHGLAFPFGGRGRDAAFVVAEQARALTALRPA
jgi:hypothetical protein